MRRITILFAAIAVIAAACSGTDTTTSTTLPGSIGTHPPRQGQTVSYGLQTFDACSDFLDYVKGNAVDLVGPWGFEYGGIGPVFAQERMMEDGAAVTSAAAGIDMPGVPQRLEQGVDYSGTNIQELGVDEPDIVKTDGRRIVAISNGTIYVVDVTGDKPRLAGQITLETGGVNNLFLSGDRVLVMGTTDSYSARPQGGIAIEPSPSGPYYYTPIATLSQIDISDIENPRLERTMYLDGSYVSARMVGDTARLVIRSMPTGLDFTFPETGGLKAERDAERRNRRVIMESTIDNWVPYYVLEDGRGNVIRDGSLLDCTRAHYPQEFSGLEMLNVLTIDLGNDLAVEDAVGVMAGGDIVYASEDAMYIASGAWQNWQALDGLDAARAADDYTTNIHKFDISDPNRTTYVATGRVTGFMLSQWSMSEYDGRLRVASTNTPNWWWNDGRRSESFVTVLEQRGDELVEVGKVGGLGKGEQIYSVRFFDDVGYVVTFRQTDPLYTIDLSNPAKPEVVGELKILGYSAYLHPIGDGLLLGVGQDASEEGRTKGTQVSVFDMSDPANPKRLHNYTLEGGYSNVEYDHRAFLYWPATGLTVIPVQVYRWDEKSGTDSGFSGAIALQANRDGIKEVGRITHGDPQANGDESYWAPPIRRSMVIGNDLFTLSNQGLLQSDLTTIEPKTLIDFWQ